MKRHYEKVICACCFLILFVNIGLPSTSFSVFQPYIVAVPGVGDTGGSIVLAVRTGTSLLSMLFVNAYYQKLNTRRGAFVASLLVALGFILFSQAGSLGGFCLAAVFTGMGYGLGGMVATTTIISRWYNGHVGRAVGIAAVGSGVAGMAIPAIMAAVIETSSLSVAFAVDAGIALVIGSITFLFMRNTPEEMGLEPFEGKPVDPAKQRAVVHLEEPLPRRLYALMLVAMVMLGSVSIDAMGYFSVLLVSEGIDRIFAAALISLIGACLTLSKAASGVMFDKMGTRNASMVFFGLLIVGLGLTVVAALGCNSAVATLAAVLLGLGVTLGTVGISVWSLELSTAEERARTVRGFQMGYTLGGFIFNIVPGVLKDLTGTYITAYVILFAFGVACAVIVISVYNRYVRPARG